MEDNSPEVINLFDADELRAKMESLSDRLKVLVLQQPPRELIGYFWTQLMLNAMHSASDKTPSSSAQLPLDDAQFVLEYIHAILSCFSSPPKAQFHLSEKDIAEINDVGMELKKVAHYYCIASTANRKTGEFGIATGQVEFFAKANWIGVRGNRYQPLEEEFFAYVLEPHDVVLQKNYGINSIAIAKGIQAITDSTRFGQSEAAKRIFDSIETANAYAKEKDITFEQAVEQLSSAKVDTFQATILAIDDLFNSGICNLSRHTSLPPKMLEDMSYDRGENSEFFAAGEFCGTPLRTLPARIKPLIKLENEYYAVDPSFFRDSAYRCIQRGLISRDKSYKEEWNRRQKALSENAFSDIFSDQIKGALVLHEVYYQDMHSGQWVEVDTLILFDDVLIQVEAKAGVAAMQSPATNFANHAKAVKNLVVSAYEQSKRFIEYLNSQYIVAVYQLVEGKYVELRKIRLSDYRTVIPLGLTVESFAPFSTICKELPNLVPILDKFPFFSVSIDDLLVLRRILQIGGELMHYLEVRQNVSAIKNALLFDEIDHLGAYIQQNRFDLTIKEQFLTHKANGITWDQFCSVVDDYFLSDRWLSEPPPKQKHPELISRILIELDIQRPSGWLALNADLRDLSGYAKTALSENLNALFVSVFEHGHRSLIFPSERPTLYWLTIEGRPNDLPELTQYCEVATLHFNVDKMSVVHIKFSEPNQISCIDFHTVTKPSALRMDLPKLQQLASKMSYRTKNVAPEQSKSVGRNDPCWCGSGRKYKRCHLGAYN